MAYTLNVANSTQQAEGASPQTATFANTPSTGSLLIATVKRGSQSGTPTITDGNSNAFTLLGTLNYNTTNSQLLVYGFIATASQSKAITVSISGTLFISIYEFDYSGGTLPVVGSILDGTVQSTTGATGVNSFAAQPSVTTTNANDLVFTTIAFSSSVTSPTSTNSTILQSNNSGGSLIQLVDGYQIETATGTYSPYFSWGTNRAWGQMTLAFLPGTTTPVATSQPMFLANFI